VEGAAWSVANEVVDRARGAVEARPDQRRVSVVPVVINLLVVAVGNRRADANGVGRWGR
jgi:hypothetical protein